VYENERSVFHSNSAKLRLLGQRMDNLVPSVNSNFCDTVLLVKLQISALLTLNVIEPFFSFSNMNK